MKTSKKCTLCETFKNISKFGIHKNTKDGLNHRCKSCNNCLSKKHKKTKHGFIVSLYTNQKANSKKRGHIPPVYTKEELKEWLYSQPLFHHLFHLWRISNYDKMITPSIDRLNDYEPYSFSNIRLVTWGENNEKSHKDRLNGVNNKGSKSVLQYSLDGDFIMEYYSILEASRRTGVKSRSISAVCKNKRNQTGGFIWKHA